MIELSFSKLLLLAVIGLIVLGPEKLPKAARMAGALVRRLRLGWESVRVEVERELEVEELRRAAKDVAGQAESVRQAAESGVRAAEAEVRTAGAEVKEAVAGAAEAADAIGAAPPKEARDGSA